MSDTEIEPARPDEKPEIFPQRSPDVSPGGPERLEPRVAPDEDRPPEVFPQHSPDATPARPPTEIPPLNAPLTGLKKPAP